MKTSCRDNLRSAVNILGLLCHGQCFSSSSVFVAIVVAVNMVVLVVIECDQAGG